MQFAKENTTVGFIGTGVMGKYMAGHLLDAGSAMHVYTRTKSKADDLVARGAIWDDSPAGVAAACDVIITMVGVPADVEEVYLGENGLVNKAGKGALFIDMTTSSPELAVKVAEAAAARGQWALDAPVSGGERGAKEAILSIMVGGDEQAFNDALPILEVMGRSIVYQGPAGSGQHTKLANQITIAAGLVGVCEGLAYAKKAGLDPQRVLSCIEKGAAASWSLSNYGPKMLAGDYAPGFYIKHFIKDMRIGVESAKKLGLDAPGLELAKSLYEKLAAEGAEYDGTQALFRLFDR